MVGGPSYVMSFYCFLSPFKLTSLFFFLPFPFPGEETNLEDKTIYGDFCQDMLTPISKNMYAFFSIVLHKNNYF